MRTAVFLLFSLLAFCARGAQERNLRCKVFAQSIEVVSDLEVSQSPTEVAFRFDTYANNSKGPEFLSTLSSQTASFVKSGEPYRVTFTMPRTAAACALQSGSFGVSCRATRGIGFRILEISSGREMTYESGFQVMADVSRITVENGFGAHSHRELSLVLDQQELKTVVNDCVLTPP